MKPVAAVALAVLTFVLGIVVGGLIMPAGETDSAGAPDSAQAEKQRLEEEIARLRTALEESDDPAKVAREGGDPAEAPAEEPSPAADKEDDPEESKEPPFFADEYEGVLRKVDWGTVGNNMQEMVKIITEIAPALRRRETPPAKAIGRIQQLNGALIAAALQVSEDLPGNGVNGKFTDPAFMLNAMASALEAAGSPLTPDQSKALEAVARTWMAADARRKQGYDEEAYAIRKLYEEAELKGRYFEDSFAKLTADQVTILSPETSRGRVRMDLFSSGLLYAALVRTVPFTDDDVLIEACVRGAAAQFRLTADEQARAQEVVADWLSDVPRDLMERETDALDVEGLVHVDRVNAWARQTHTLLKSLVAEFGADEARRDGARRSQVVVVPLKNPPQGD